MTWTWANSQSLLSFCRYHRLNRVHFKSLKRNLIPFLFYSSENFCPEPLKICNYLICFQFSFSVLLNFLPPWASYRKVLDIWRHSASIFNHFFLVSTLGLFSSFLPGIPLQHLYCLKNFLSSVNFLHVHKWVYVLNWFLKHFFFIYM